LQSSCIIQYDSIHTYFLAAAIWLFSKFLVLILLLVNIHSMVNYICSGFLEKLTSPIPVPQTSVPSRKDVIKGFSSFACFLTRKKQTKQKDKNKTKTKLNKNIYNIIILYIYIYCDSIMSCAICQWLAKEGDPWLLC